MAEPAPCVVDQSSSFSSQFFSSLNQLRINQTFTDFCIHVGDKTLACHKVVLSAACPYFLAMLTSGMKEAQEQEVSLDHLDGEVVSALVEYFYTGVIKVEWGKMKAAIEACEMLQIEALKSVFVEYICKNLAPENCIGWYKLAEKFFLEEVMVQARLIIKNELSDVSQNQEFKDLDMAEVIDCLKICEGTPGGVALKACLNWALDGSESHRDSVSDLLEHISLEDCPIPSLQDALMQCLSINVCHSTLLKISNELFSADKRETGGGKPSLTLVGGMRSHVQEEVNHQVFLFDNNAIKWKGLSNIPVDNICNRSSVCISKNGFFILGGSQGSDTSYRNTCNFYNAKDHKWTELAPLPYAANRIASVELNGNIYALGGYNGKQLANVCHYRFDANKWHEDPPMLAPQSWPIVCSALSNIYVMYKSGATGSELSLQEYSSMDSKWEYKAKLPPAVKGTEEASAVALDRNLYLVGGQNKACAKYTIDIDTWTVLTQPAHVHKYGASFLWRGCIYLCGGIGSPFSDVMEVYDVKKDKWETSDLKLPVAFHKMAATSWC